MRAAGAVVQVQAPGKINLFLSVAAPEPDGYHPLTTLFAAVNLYETVTVRESPPGAGIRVTVRAHGLPDGQQAPLGSDNLAARAATLFAESTGCNADLRIHIDKWVPVGGGMAGGSADAAATLLACDTLWGAAYGPDRLQALAARLGADVPFALRGGMAVGQGYGEKLTAVNVQASLHWVLVFAPFALSTPRVFGVLDRLRQEGGSREARLRPVPRELLAALASADARAVAPWLGNDLEPAALHCAPQLHRILALGQQVGALRSLISGSGPTTVFLAENREHAQWLVTRFEESLAGEGYLVRAACTPAAGARQVAELLAQYGTNMAD